MHQKDVQAPKEQDLSVKGSALFYISMHLLQITRQIGVAYVTATTTALATAVGLNLYTKVHRDGIAAAPGCILSPC